MQSERISVSRKPGRVPRKGTFFSLMRWGGLLLAVLGLLLLSSAVIGFFIAAVRIGPTLLGALQHLEQQMAGFIFLISLVNLLIIALVGLLGIAMLGVSVVLGYVGTEPAGSTTVFRLSQTQNSQHPESQ